MFKISLYCDDRRVGDVLRAIAGISRGHPEVIPVTNAEATPKGLKQIHGNGLIEAFGAHLKETKVARASAAEAKAFLKAAGRSPGSASYLLKKAREAGVLGKRSGKGSSSTYEVVS